MIERCAELVSQGESDKFLYLAASHPLLELVTEQILDGAKTPGMWGELPVYLFRGFVRRVLTTARNSQSVSIIAPRVPIDREELPLKRSLISQILKQLAANGQLSAIKPLANREGCVNTISTLVGEIQRAGKNPAELSEIVEKRMRDFAESDTDASGQTGLNPGVFAQTDFDRDIAIIYSTYAALLQQNNLTEADADQLRALAILNGSLDGQPVRLPWLENVKLLVLDGFFDFTPVQGGMLRELVRQIPDVVVHLNSDERNPAIFAPFSTTIEQLKSITDFKVISTEEAAPARGALACLREQLFKPSDTSPLPEPAADDNVIAHQQQNIRLLTCADRETEIRKIAKEIKRLVVQEEFRLAEIALVVRERASYADTIARIMRDESIPCDLERRINITEISAVRAARKLFEMLDDMARTEKTDVKVSDLADLIKSEYFRLDDSQLAGLNEVFEQKYGVLLTSNETANGEPDTGERRERFKHSLGIGWWDPDSLENTVAFVGGALSMSAWLERARKLLSNWPQVKATTEMVTPEAGDNAGDEETDQIEDADKVATDDRGVEKKRRPSRDVHPAAIAWAALVTARLTELAKAVPREASPRVLRSSLMLLLEHLQFSSQIRKPARATLEENELPHVMLDVRGLEALRRAFLVAVKSIDLTRPILGATQPDDDVRLTAFLGEVSRALDVEVSIGRTSDRGGLRVLEATDVRGLRFRAIFIAGLVEGGFPLRASRDWIYPHEERERLKRDYDLTLEDISPATLLKEEHYFYQAACRATDRLYLSLPLLLDDGTETVGSYYINELARAIRPFRLESEPVRRDFDGAEIFDASTAAELTVSMTRQDERHRHKVARDRLQPLEVLNALGRRAQEARYLSPSMTRRIEIERERSSNRFGPYDGQITTPALLRLLQQRFGPEHVHSASGLSTYGNCSYRFFANRVLRLEPRGEAALDLQAIDAGKLLHDVLRRFFEKHRGQRLLDQDRESLRMELRAVAEQVFQEHERAVPPLNPDIWKIDCEIRKIILDQVLLYELGVQKQTRADVRSSYFEVAFGMTPRDAADPKSKTEKLELTRETATGEQSIQIQGQIDRVDEADDGTLIAYDYKLSTGADAEDMKAGRSLQLPIYLEALERLLLPGRRIAGGGYYILKAKPGRRNSGIYRKDFGDYLGLQARNSILSDFDWHKVRAEVIEKIWEFFDGMRAGDFRVRPSEGLKTCRFCDYAAVCRYDRYRIGWKEMEPAKRSGP
ncbi:MAG: PD-(D/E)XK nuclease family protein [Acidobacteriota bacterium]|nr:PD-(D/E)XK nuclease family protein [Acidobacteriota bacterium]